MRRQCVNPTIGAQDAWCDFFPVRRVCNLFIENMMDRYCFGRDRPARIDQQRAALIRQCPAPVIIENHVLPADLADVVAPFPALSRSTTGTWVVDLRHTRAQVDFSKRNPWERLFLLGELRKNW